MAKGPVLIELDDTAEATSVTDAPPVPEPDGMLAEGEAMRSAAALASYKPSRVTRWFWGLAATVLASFIAIAAWEFVTALVARNAYLGWALTALLGAFFFTAFLLSAREIAALGRMARVDALRQSVDAALTSGSLQDARQASDRVVSFYAKRKDTRWGRERFDELAADQLDAEALLGLTETEVLGPLDQLAVQEVEAAARQVAAVTALVPLALADVAAALVANLRMIRRIAEIYGGRSGVLGGWRLTRAVLSHMIATGAVAVGDDLLEPVLGGSVLTKVSRRFGEGLVNGALTARVGVAAMDVCRPMPFARQKRPRVREIIARALSGFFVSSRR